MNRRIKITAFFSGNRIPELIFFIPFFLVCLYLSYDFNFLNHIDRSPKIYSDKSNYYVYLPATFIYGWDVNKFPFGIEQKCNGFLLDKKNNKVVTKTTCGVAILLAPFFLVTHFIALHWNLQPDGFSDIYERMTVIPGVLYLVLGLFFLGKFLRYYYSRKISYITVLLIFLGTNLYFYGIYDGLMSHVYSFFFFSLFLFLLKKFLEQRKKSYRLLIGLSVVFSFAVLIRPSNILLFSWVLFLDIRSWKEIGNRIILFFKPWYILIFILTALIVFLPQFLYWKYLSGHYVWYSYTGETFSNWRNPRLIPVWFSTLNGFFLYTPLALCFIAGIILMIVKKVLNGIFIGVSFLVVSYVFASWYCWHFGGSFGYRPLVEYYTLFSLPLAYLVGAFWRLKNLYFKSVMFFLILLSVNYNLRLTYHQRWNIYSTWSWDNYLLYLDYTGLYNYSKHSYTYIQDFENFGIPVIFPIRDKCTHSLMWAGYVDKSIEFNELYSWRLDKIYGRTIQQVKAELWINPGKQLRTRTRFACKIMDPSQKQTYFREVKVDDFLKGAGKWSKVSATFEIPEWIDQANTIIFFVWNPAKTDTTYIDDLKLRFE